MGTSHREDSMELSALTLYFKEIIFANKTQENHNLGMKSSKNSY